MHSLARTPHITDAWQQHTLRANTEYQLACYDDAIQLHRRALEHATEDFPLRLRFCIDHALARVLISHFSLADCYRALADVERAAQCYLDAQRFLLRCKCESVPHPRLQHAIAHGNLHLQQLWSEFVSECDADIPEACRCAYRDDNMRLAQDAGGASVLH